MPNINHRCPNCQNVMLLPSEFIGRQGKCTKCRHVSTVSAVQQTVEPPLPTPSYSSVASTENPYAPGEIQRDVGEPNSLETDQGACPYPGRLIKIVLDFIESNFTDSQLTTLSNKTGSLAGWCIIGTGLAFVIFVTGLAIRFESVEPLMFVPLGLALIVLLQFVNHHSLRGISSMLKEEFPMSGKTYLRIVGSVWLFGTVAIPFLIILLIYQSVDQYEPYVTLAVLFVLCGFMTLITTRPLYLGIKFDQSASIVDDTLAVGIYNFKAFAALTPYLYFLGVNLLTAILFIQGIIYLFSDGEGYMSESEILPVVYLTLYPLVIYMAALGSLTFTYVIKSILDTPRRLADLQNHK